MSSVCIAGVGMTKFGKYLNRSLKDLAKESILQSIDDAGINSKDIQAVFVANAMGGIVTGQETIVGQVVLGELGIRGIPVFNIENACASGSSALHLASQFIKSKEYDTVLVVGVEKLYHVNKSISFQALASATDIETLTDISNSNSIFMEIYAQEARNYMNKTGCTPVTFAQVAEKNHFHSSLNPYAQYQNTVTVEEVLQSQKIVDPLTRMMCSPIGDGSASLILTNEEKMNRIGKQKVRILASRVKSGDNIIDPISSLADEAYHAAGVGPEDISVAEVHDATSSAEVILYEKLGFCREGEGPRLVSDGITRLGGKLPVNPSGGLVSKGHPIAATGVAQIVELTWQLRGEASDRQIPNAKVGLAECAGGWVLDAPAAVSIIILGI